MITGLSVVIAYVVGKKVSLPIRKLSLATREIAKGNYTFIADVDGTDEIADLAHSFNHMTAKLRDTLSELSIKNEELDALVEQITIDLVLSNRKLHDLFENMSSGVAVYQASPDGMDFVFVAINKASERLENISRKDVIGKSVVEAFPGVEQFGLLDVFRRVWKTGNPEQFPLAFYQDKRIEGWRDNFVYKLPSGEIVAIYDDVTEKKRLQQDLEERANTDFLTGLLNRRCFMERGLVEFTRSTRYERSLAVLMFDIDHFKKVNDTYGHQAGDIVIRTVAEVALTVVREVDLVGRLGGGRIFRDSNRGGWNGGALRCRAPQKHDGKYLYPGQWGFHSRNHFHRRGTALWWMHFAGRIIALCRQNAIHSEGYGPEPSLYWGRVSRSCVNPQVGSVLFGPWEKSAHGSF